KAIYAVLLTFRHRAGVSPYTASYDFARTCVFSKQSLPPGLCDPTQLQTHGPSPHRAPLLPKLRGQFAEFLNHGSPERLGILYLTTCVGLAYGPSTHSLEAFLGSTRSLTSAQRLDIAPHPQQSTDLPMLRATRLTRDNHRPVELPPRVTPSLTYYSLGPHTNTTPTHKGQEQRQSG